MGDSSANSLSRWYESDGPWTHHRLTAGPQESTARPTDINPGLDLNTSALIAGVTQNPTRSEIGSTATEIVQSDSGYASKSHTTLSVVSSEISEINRDCGSISSQARSWRNFQTQEGLSTPLDPLSQQVLPSQFEIRKDNFPCKYCESTFGCGSELKYV